MEFNPITANLLAAENLTVVQGSGKSAHFNVESRVLQVPVMDAEAYDILIPHEVGHALHTNESFNDVFCKATKAMRQFYNILEDVRVEKLIKRQYPGLR